MSYLVTTENFADTCEFDTLDDALDFVHDQIEMGIACTVFPPVLPATFTSSSVTELITHHVITHHDILAGDS